MTQSNDDYEYYGLFQTVIDQLERWTVDDAKQAEADWREAGKKGRDPLGQWMAWNQLIPPLHEKYKAGDSTALFLAISHCHSSGLPLPHWCGKAFSLGLARVESYDARGWDDAFNNPNKGKKLPDLRRERKTRIHAVDAALKKITGGQTVESAFEEIAAEYAVSYELIRRWYYEHCKRSPFTIQMRADGYYKKKTGHADSEAVKVGSLNDGISKHL